MPFCTIVEFEWDETFDREHFTSMVGAAGADSEPVAGRLSRIAGIDEHGARMIEVWQSGDDARAFAERSAPALAGAALPQPSRVVGFEVTSYEVS